MVRLGQSQGEVRFSYLLCSPLGDCARDGGGKHSSACCTLEPPTRVGGGPGVGTNGIGPTVGGRISPLFLASSPWHCPSP